MRKIHKVIKVLIDTLMTLILIIGIVFIISYLIGFEPFVVESGSMKPTIQKDSLCFINKNVKFQDIRENDIIAFKASSGARVTHRAISITEEGIETKGDANNKSDGITTTKSNYIGKNVFSIPYLGCVIKLIQTTSGKILLITIIIVVLILGFLEDAKKKGKRYKDE